VAAPVRENRTHGTFYVPPSAARSRRMRREWAASPSPRCGCRAESGAVRVGSSGGPGHGNCREQGSTGRRGLGRGEGAETLYRTEYRPEGCLANGVVSCCRAAPGQGRADASGVSAEGRGLVSIWMRSSVSMRRDWRRGLMALRHQREGSRPPGGQQNFAGGGGETPVYGCEASGIWGTLRMSASVSLSECRCMGEVQTHRGAGATSRVANQAERSSGRGNDSQYGTVTNHDHVYTGIEIRDLRRLAYRNAK